MGIDLPLIWFVIIVFSTMMYVVMDGFDLGIGILFPWVKESGDRDLMMNTVAPVWDGNETLAGTGRCGAVRRLPAGLLGDPRRAGHPADADADRADFPRRGLRVSLQGEAGETPHLG